MKKILLLLIIIISINSFAQFPATQSQGTVNTRVVNNGGFQAMKGLINGVFADTTSANADYIDFYNGAQIYTRSDRNFWLRDSVLNSWVRMAKFSDVGSGSLTWPDTTTIYNNLKWSRILNNESNSTTYSPVLHKELTVDMSNKQLTFDNADGIYFNSNVNDWSINGGGFGLDHQSVISNAITKRIDFSSGYSSTRRSTISFHPDSISFFPGGGKVNIDSLRTGTGDDEVMTWNAGMVRKMPTVKYNITSPADGDILVYDIDNNEWINVSNTDSSFYLKEYDDLGSLDTTSYNAAIIEGRLWIYNRSGGTWRRQAYDSTYTPAVTYFTEDFTGGDGDAVSGRSTTTGSLTWAASAGTTIGQSILSNADHAATKNSAISLYTVDPGHHDIDLRATIGAIQSPSPLMFLMLAAADDNNFIQVDLVTCQIFQNVASSYSSLYGGSGTSSPGDIIRCNLNGTTLDVYRNGSLVHSQAVSGSLTSSKCGIFFYNDGGATGSTITFIEGRQAQ